MSRWHDPAALIVNTMHGPTNTLLIEGSFEELADELAHYIHEVQKKQIPDSANTQAEIAPLIEKGQKDEVLKKLVRSSEVLNSAPEKEFIAAYNLLVHLVRQSPNLDKFLPKICQNLSAPIKSSPTNGPGLSLSILTTIFNILPPTSETRYHVFLNVLRVIRGSSSFELLRPQLNSLDSWITAWEIDEEDQRKLYLTIADAAAEAGEDSESYLYLLRALRTIPLDEVSSSESHALAIRALKVALSHPSHFDFQDLTSSDTIQALQKSDPDWYELLEIFNAELLDDYNDFLESHEEFLEKSDLDASIMHRKMRLLTLASLAATTQTRSLPYQHIERSLQIPSEDVEMWVIDVIRAGLVEGKLSQLNQTFLIHRSTYRVFGEKQWTEVQGRLDTWRTSLEGVLEVVRQERIKMATEKERELRDLEERVNGGGGGGGMGRGMGGGRGGPRDFDMGLD